MPIDPYFLDKERRQPPDPEEPALFSRVKAFAIPGIIAVACLLFLAAWFYERFLMPYIFFMALVCVGLFIWKCAARFSQDGAMSLWFDRSILTDIVLGEHDHSAWPALLLFIAVLATLASSYVLVLHHSRSSNQLSTGSSVSPAPK